MKNTASKCKIKNVNTQEINRKTLESCQKEHINNKDVMRQLYRKGLSKMEFSDHLEQVVFPVYQSAQSMGFKEWVYEK